MKCFIIVLFAIALSCDISLSQIAISTSNTAPDASAVLDVSSTTKGFLMPRMTQAQLLAISLPADGLQVYCTTDSKVYIFIGGLGQWKEVSYGTGIITPPFTCGLSITVTHTAGNVAPVTKTTSYGTVTNIPGETSKCWITSNLGSDHQATAVSDATEASAGWYWQFNRMQGYKHDGSTLTPTGTWQVSISESSNWVAENDPCNLLLANGWRVPTFTELDNIDASGNWTNWDGPWGSALKMHASGYLYTGGSLQDRGSSGIYGSSSQQSNTQYKLLQLTSSWCVSVMLSKITGSTIRCVKE